MAIDYTKLAATAKRLVDQSGRSVTLNRFDQSPPDDDIPWEGPADPSDTPDATATVIGCFVPLETGKSLGLETLDVDLMKRTAEVCLVAPGTISPPFDLATANELVDDSVSKRVTFVRTLKPASITLLYFIGVAR